MPVLTEPSGSRLDITDDRIALCLGAHVLAPSRHGRPPTRSKTFSALPVNGFAAAELRDPAAAPGRHGWAVRRG